MNEEQEWKYLRVQEVCCCLKAKQLKRKLDLKE